MGPLPRKSMQCPNCGAPVAEDQTQCKYCHSVLTITACPSCFNAVFKGMRFCPACGAAISRSEDRNDLQLMCPRCDQILTAADIAGTRIRECGSCGGIWLDTETFQKICSEREQQEKALVYPSPASAAEPLTPEKYYIPCPECGVLMNRKNFAACSGVVLDVCKSHGIWFDRLELQRIVTFIQDGGLHKAREIELDNLKAEQDRLRAMQYGPPLGDIPAQEGITFPGLEDDRSLIRVIGSILAKILAQ